MADSKESHWQLSHIDESDFEVLPQLRDLTEVLQSVDHELDDPGLVELVKLFDDLLLAVQVNRAAHNDERSVEGIIQIVGVRIIQEPGGTLNDLVVDALLLAVFVDGHVTQNSEAQHADGGVVISL